MLDRRDALTFLIGSAAACATRASFAQGTDTFPTRPVTLVHQYTPGGTTDIVARILADGLDAKWGQRVLVDSRPGGGGIVGAANVASAAPDGYTMLLTISLMSILPAINKRLPFDVERSFTPIGRVASLPFAILMSKESGITTVEQLVNRAKQNPDKLTCGSPGIGTPHHLALEVFDKTAGIKLRHVPYKGAAGIMTDLTAGRIDMTFLGVAGTSGFIEAGSAIPIAVTSAERTPLLPKTPTIVESGYPQYVQETWYGLLGPAGVPAETVERIYRDVSEVLKQPGSKKRMDVHGLDIAPEPSDVFKKRIHDEIAFYKELVVERRIEVN